MTDYPIISFEDIRPGDTIRSVCSVTGCQSRKHAGGMCSKHYHRFVRYGDTGFTKIPRNLGAWGTVEYHGWQVSETGCWMFQGPKDQLGYGRINIKPGRSALRAHRVSYEHHVGTIPDGLLIRHKCDTPSCINPDHLVPGTDADNAMDRAIRGRSKTKLSPAQVRKICSIYTQGGVTQRDLARKFGVSQSLISMIVSGQRRPTPARIVVDQ